jgi:hypothetical protein
MPKLIRLYIVSVATGFALAAAFVALLLWFDVARLGSLVANSDIGAIAVALLVVFHGIVFAGVQFGLGVMRAGREDDTPRGGLGAFTFGDSAPVPVPVRVTAKGARRRI